MNAREIALRFDALCYKCGCLMCKGAPGVYVWYDLDFCIMHRHCARTHGVEFIELPKMAWENRDSAVYDLARTPWHEYDIIKMPKRPIWCCFKDRIIFFAVAESGRSEASRLVAEQALLDTPPNVSRNLREKLDFYKKGLAFRLRVFYNSESAEVAALAVSENDEGLFAKEHDMAKTVSSRAAAAPKAAPASAQPAAPAQPAAEEAPATPAPKKDRVSLSEEEIQDAVNGVLNPREVVGDANQEGLTKVDDRGRPAGRPIGVNTGLPILGAWCLAFQENEKDPAQNPQSPTDTESIISGLGKAPDTAITAFMKGEFPGRNTPAFDHPQSCRNDFMAGKFTKNIKPKFVSSRYDDQGNIIPPGRRTAQPEAPAEPEPAPAAPAPAPARAPARRAAPAATPVAKPVAAAPVAKPAAPAARRQPVAAKK
jgi:hypothetical protein